MKKIRYAALVGVIALIAAVATAGGIADAQLFPYTGSTTAATATTTTTSTSITTTTSSTSSTPSSSLPLPTPTISAPAPIPVAPGYIQLNGLTVLTASPVNTPVIVTAENPASCESFATLDASATSGVEIPCPMPEGISTFSVLVSGTTDVLLNDRAAATFASIMPGDIINAFGYYDGLGTVEASIVRDLSQSAGSVATGSSGMTSTNSPSITAIEAQITQIQSAISQIIQEISLLMASPPNNASTSY